MMYHDTDFYLVLQVCNPRDHSGGLPSLLRADGSALVLVRPDRHVAAATVRAPAGTHEHAAATKVLVARNRMSDEKR
jgi:hypothetical protein